MKLFTCALGINTNSANYHKDDYTDTYDNASWTWTTLDTIITQVFGRGLRLPERILKPLLSLIALLTNNKDDASRDSLLSLSYLKVVFCSSTIDFFHIYIEGISSGSTKASTIALQGWAFEMPFE